MGRGAQGARGPRRVRTARCLHLAWSSRGPAPPGWRWSRPSPRPVEELSPSPLSPAPTPPAFSGRRRPARGVCAESPADRGGVGRGCPGRQSPGRRDGRRGDPSITYSGPTLVYTARKEGTQKVFVTAQRSGRVSGKGQGVTVLTWGGGVCNRLTFVITTRPGCGVGLRGED